NRLTVIQEHFMILRAIKSGVTEERMARSLDVDVQSIRQKRDLLEGICPEAVDAPCNSIPSVQTVLTWARVRAPDHPRGTGHNGEMFTSALSALHSLVPNYLGLSCLRRAMVLTGTSASFQHCFAMPERKHRHGATMLPGEVHLNADETGHKNNGT